MHWLCKATLFELLETVFLFLNSVTWSQENDQITL